jgi:hypothetical protein
LLDIDFLLNPRKKFQVAGLENRKREIFHATELWLRGAAKLESKVGIVDHFGIKSQKIYIYICS